MTKMAATNRKKRKNYIFTNRRHPSQAIMATILGTISLLSLIFVIWRTAAAGGNASAGYGLTGLFAMLFSIVGLVMGIMTIQQKRNFKLFPIVGIVLNSIVLLVIIILLGMGRA